MSLNYDFSKVTDFEILHDDENQWAISQGVIYSMMFCDIGTITHTNIDEVLFRFTVYKRLFGAIMTDSEGKGYEFTRADIERRIGLGTNVLTLNRTRWQSKIMRQAEKEIVGGRRANRSAA